MALKKKSYTELGIMPPVRGTGAYYFVSSSIGSDNYIGTKEFPFATVDKAIGFCSSGDTVYILPGHAETLSSATALACDVAGVTFEGLGWGTSRPTFTMGTAATTKITVSVANVTWKNCVFTANYADITTCFNLTTAKYFTLDNCYFNGGSGVNFLTIVTTNATSNAADGLKIVGCKWVDAATTCNAFVTLVGTNDGIVIGGDHLTGNYISLGVHNNTASIMAIATGKIATNLICGFNRVYRLNTDTATGGILITTDGSTNSGMVFENKVFQADTAAEILVTASSGFGLFDNKTSSVVTASGYVLPAIDS